MVRKTREGSNEASSSSLGTVAKLVKVGMTFTRGTNYFVAFNAFIGIISAKLYVSEITSSRADQYVFLGMPMPNT